MNSSEENQLSERDKPFVLAVLSLVLVILCIIGGFLDLPFASDGLKVASPLTMMAWTFYFVKKEG